MIYRQIVAIVSISTIAIFVHFWFNETNLPPTSSNDAKNNYSNGTFQKDVVVQSGPPTSVQVGDKKTQPTQVLLEHSPLDKDSAAFAYTLFSQHRYQEALIFSKKIIQENQHPDSIEALPVLMSAYKEIGRAAELRQFIFDTTIYFSQLGDEKHQRLDDFVSNLLILMEGNTAYSMQEKLDVLETLQSAGIPDYIKKYALEFSGRLLEACSNGGCDESTSNYSG